MTELLVILACTSGKGCNETLEQYRLATPSFQELVHNTETIVQKNVPGVVLQYYAPVIYFMSGQDGQIGLTRNVGLKLNMRGSGEIRYKFDW